MSPYPNPIRSGPGLQITGSHLLVLAPAGSASVASIHRPLAVRLHAEVLNMVQPLAPSQLTAEIYVQKFATSFSSMGRMDAQLPPNVELITIESAAPGATVAGKEGVASNSVLLRVAHQFGVGEDAVLSQAAQFDLASLFAGSTIASVLETVLMGTRALADAPPKLQWAVEGESSADEARLQEEREARHGPIKDGTVITLNPLQIRTFNITFAPAAVADELEQNNNGAAQ
jgi:hypothetical protein